MFDVIFALARMYKAFYEKEYKTDAQFDAMDGAVEIFAKHPDEKQKAFAALELI